MIRKTTEMYLAFKAIQVHICLMVRVVKLGKRRTFIILIALYINFRKKAFL